MFPSPPEFYKAEKVGRLCLPDSPAAIEAGRSLGLPPSADDTRRTLLLLIDAQVDFIHEDGALAVPGAVEDTRRTAEWIYCNAGSLTAIAASLDSHVPQQIFFPNWWSDENGAQPPPFTAISSADAARGRWNPHFERDWSLSYVKRLEEEARKELMIWPYHTLIGTPGHAITPSLWEAIAFHSAARRSRPVFVHKGTIPKTEFYSILEPEIEVPGDPQGKLDEGFLNVLLGYDRVYVAGQAKSHCVLETLSSILRRVGDDPTSAGRFHLLTDCTSPVSHPEVDFEAIADRAFSLYEKQGLRLVNSREPVV